MEPEDPRGGGASLIRARPATRRPPAHAGQAPGMHRANGRVHAQPGAWMGGMHEEMDVETPLEKKLDDLYDIIANVKIAMFTTRRSDGMLVSRPMATQRKQQHIADFWFVTDVTTEKVDELIADPHVSLAYYDSGSWEWVSVSGVVTISTDRDLIRRLYQPDWKAWFSDEGGDRDGSPDDPRFAILMVEAHSVIYGKETKAKPFALFEIAKSVLKREKPDVQKIRRLEGDELR
jgi:general stress protein 26